MYFVVYSSAWHIQQRKTAMELIYSMIFWIKKVIIGITPPWVATPLVKMIRRLKDKRRIPLVDFEFISTNFDRNDRKKLSLPETDRLSSQESAIVSQTIAEEEIKSSLEDAKQRKLLSIVVVGRNDNYMGNFKYRLSTCLNYLARNLKNIGRLDDVEVVVTDWNSEVSLAKGLPLLPEAAKICRFVCVPPEVAKSFVKPGRVFCFSCATNVALRRAKGDFVMFLTGDSLLPSYSLKSLLDLLDGNQSLPFKLDRCLFLFTRHLIPTDVVMSEPSLAEWDRYLWLNSGQLPRQIEHSGWGTHCAAQMMHRELWHACRGYDEKIRDWGWSDAELTLRITQENNWLELSSIGVSTFEMAHEQERSYQRITTEPRSSLQYEGNLAFVANDDNWGLGNYQFNVQTAENICDFSQIVFTGFKHEMGEKLLDELTSETVRRYLQETIKLWWDVPLEESASMYALAWYSLYHYPRSYLEFGLEKGFTAAAVAAACPSVEIYGIDSWSSSNIGSSKITISSAAWNIQQVGYRGYTRFVTGDPSTGFSRLKESCISPLSLDLVLLRADMFGIDATKQLNQIVPYVRSGGAIVIYSISEDIFKSVWSEMQEKYFQFTYLQCKKLNTGIALAVK